MIKAAGRVHSPRINSAPQISSTNPVAPIIENNWILALDGTTGKPMIFAMPC